MIGQITRSKGPQLSDPVATSFKVPLQLLVVGCVLQDPSEGVRAAGVSHRAPAPHTGWNQGAV